jgi:antitoxin MazE
MDISVIKVGNSKGIRLSKTLIERYNIKDTVEIIMEKEYMILKPKTAIREGWEDSFQQMHDNGDDKALMDNVFLDETFEEWK